jgi:rare lipoprotein A (peptidoglycan hydrolase)
MLKTTAFAFAALTLLASPAAADRDGGGDWLSKAFSASPAAKSSGKSGKTYSSPVSSSSSSGGSSAGSGIASYYWQPQQVASGGTFNPNALTAAHKTLPFGTRVRVTSSNGRSVDVVINDRGPFVKGRVIDLLRSAAQETGMTGAGLASVRLQVL